MQDINAYGEVVPPDAAPPGEATWVGCVKRYSNAKSAKRIVFKIDKSEKKTSLHATGTAPVLNGSDTSKMPNSKTSLRIFVLCCSFRVPPPCALRPRLWHGRL